MSVIFSILKWLSWLAAALMAGLILMLLIAGSGPSNYADWLFALLWCGLLAFPGLLIHWAQKRMAN
jgi:hypothetical protein